MAGARLAWIAGTAGSVDAAANDHCTERAGRRSHPSRRRRSAPCGVGAVDAGRVAPERGTECRRRWGTAVKRSVSRGKLVCGGRTRYRADDANRAWRVSGSELWAEQSGDPGLVESTGLLVP